MAGREKYKEALELMALAWKGSKDSLLNEVLIAVAEFVRVYSGKYNAGILVEALKKHKPRVIAQNIKSDFEHPGFKKHIYQIYKIYNDSCGDVKLPRCF